VFVGRRRIARIDRHLDRGDELMEAVRRELELNRESHERNYEMIQREFELNRREAARQYELSRREHRETRSAVQSLRSAVRALTVQVEENTRVLRDVGDGVRAQNEGLRRVLDELRGRGPGGEPATS
jgi:Skp family chaperone for outer membrane proteins